MAALGCCQLDRSSCPKAAIKIAIEKLATITIYQLELMDAMGGERIFLRL